MTTGFSRYYSAAFVLLA